MFEYEYQYCSFCFYKTKHVLINSKPTGNTYKCTNCLNTTIKCKVPNCENMAKGDARDHQGFCAVHSGFISSFEKLNMKFDNILDYKIMLKREHVNAQRICLTVGLVASGALVIGPAAFFSASAIGGAIGTTFLTSSSGSALYGAAATKAGLAFLGGGALSAGGAGIAGGIAVISATGTGLGGVIGGVVANSYFGEIKGFEIKKIKDGNSPSVLFINGFLTEKNEEYKQWETELKKIYPNNAWYYAKWESKRLRHIGNFLAIRKGDKYFIKSLQKAAKRAAKTAPSKLRKFNASILFFQLITNPWHVALVKANQTGVLLAEIIARVKNDNFILIGHSLGARVIFNTLRALSTKEKTNIFNVHLLGGAVGKDNKEEWSSCSKAVEDRIYNYYTEKDRVLKYMYRIGNLFTSIAIGRASIDNDIERIVDKDVSEHVSSHTEFIPKLSKYINNIDRFHM